MRGKFYLFLIFLGILIFFVGLWFYQKNNYSIESLKLEILGPDKVEVGEEVQYIIKYKNNGNVRLENPKLFFQYPKYTIVEKENSSEEIFSQGTIKEINLKDIYPGQERSFIFKMRFFGKKGDLRTLRAWLTYQPKNLKARYESKTSFVVQIASCPLNFEFDFPSKVESGREIDVVVNYFSNIEYPLSNLGVKVEYPTGFEYQSSNPSSLDGKEWEIKGVVNKAEGGRIVIKGVVKGEVGEEKVFKAKLGWWYKDEFLVLKEIEKTIKIVAPSLYISQKINGTPQYIPSPGDLLHYEISFRNIGHSPLSNLFLIVKLEGNGFDFTTLKAPLGEFEVGDNSILFDGKKVPSLQFLDVGEEGKVEFWIKLKKEWKRKEGEEGEVLRTKVYLSQAQKEFITKVKTLLKLTQEGYYFDQIFGNSGPLPPEVGKETTYTIIWRLKNYYNEVKNIKVKGKLDKNVRLSGKILPEDSHLTFDSLSHEILWKIEKMEPGEGVEKEGPEVAFQIIFTPSNDQRGKTVKLIKDVSIEAEDEFTQTLISQKENIQIDTSLPHDQKVTNEMGKVK